MNRLAVWVFLSTVLYSEKVSNSGKNPGWLDWLINVLKKETRNLNSIIYRVFWKGQYYYHIEVFLANHTYHQIINNDGRFLYWPKEIFDIYQLERKEKTIVWRYFGTSLPGK